MTTTLTVSNLPSIYWTILFSSGYLPDSVRVTNRYLDSTLARFVTPLRYNRPQSRYQPYDHSRSGYCDFTTVDAQSLIIAASYRTKPHPLATPYILAALIHLQSILGASLQIYRRPCRTHNFERLRCWPFPESSTVFWTVHHTEGNSVDSTDTGFVKACKLLHCCIISFLSKSPSLRDSEIAVS